MQSTAAKRFLISRVIEEAEVERVNLSDVEKKMLHFTEVHPSIPDIYEVNAEFERNYNSAEYEAKIAGLLKAARERDSSLNREQEWKDALGALKNEDHYILVMVGQAFGFGSASAKGHRVRDFLIYIPVGIGVVLIIVLKAFWKARH